MYGDQFRVADVRQSSADRFESGLPAFAEGVRAVESVFLAEALPVGDVGFRQNHDDAAALQRLGEPFDGVHQDRAAADRQKLFGLSGLHAASAASGYDDDGYGRHVFRSSR